MTLKHFLSKLKKTKLRRVLVLSAGGKQAGIQGICIGSTGTTWEILSHAYLPYPQKIGDLVERLAEESQENVSMSELGWLEYKLSQLLLECAKMVQARLSRTIKDPHYIALHKLTLWKGKTGEQTQQSTWDLSIGDPQFLASSMGVPVLSNFVRHNILGGGPGNLPVFPGNMKLLSNKYAGAVLLLNIGITTRLTILDLSQGSLLLDSDCGPGTCLINKCAQEALFPDGFDRDGSGAAQGKAHSENLDKLANTPWFLQPSPKTANSGIFNMLLQLEHLLPLAPLDKLATFTALTARSAYDFYRREYKGKQPEAVLLSGGGAKNLTLVDYLKTYFDPVAVKSIEEIGIPLDMRISLALGLTVDTHIAGANVPWESGSSPRMEPLGQWFVP